MKHNLVNFTRGSQLLGHFGFMFAAGLRGPLLVTVLVILGLGWWEVRSSLSEQEVYLLWMHLYASAYGFMEFDPGKLVHLKLGNGETAAFPMSVVTQYPPMRAAVAAFGEALRSTFLVAHLNRREQAVKREMGRWRHLMERLTRQVQKEGTREEFTLDCHDLSLENVFVDPEDPTTIVSCIPLLPSSFHANFASPI